ncbi:hypothetical protein N7522_004350 [Penicillium canescens]|nr:hypothetical protein N7522_004350 [Penicillium canescens]
MRLAHLHLPNTTPFARVSHLQQTLTTRLLTHKKLASPGSLSSQAPLDTTDTLAKSLPPPPDPTIITFTPNPVYTTGRRDLPPSNTSPPNNTNNTPLSPPQPSNQSAQSSPRGKMAHPHAQSTTQPSAADRLHIMDLGRWCHIRVLENSVIDLLGGFGVKGFTTEDPGVWVRDTANGNGDAKKITAVGVHLRRNISSFGIGLNVTQEPMWFFRQIVACGLEGKEATSLQGVGVGDGVSVDDIADAFVMKFVERVNADFACGEKALGERIDEVYRVREEDLL